MKKLLLIVFSIFQLCQANSQALSLKDFLSASSFTPKKFTGFITRKNFLPVGNKFLGDTLVNTYSLKIKKSKKTCQRVVRIIESFQKGSYFSFVIRTSSFNEYAEGRRELKEADFFCGNESDSTGNSFVYQQKNITVLVKPKSQVGGDTLFSFFFYEIVLPFPETINYAEDLLQITSHEYLAGIFGEKNVIKDLYYFADKEILKCSVLFPHTQRQAVFVWSEQENLRGISFLLIGGNIRTAGTINYNEVVAENNWISKNGVYSGMSLRNLARINGDDFKFTGINSESPFMVVPEKTGKIDFTKCVVFLGCLNPGGSKLLNNKLVNTSEILSENLGLYVNIIMLSPSTFRYP